MTSTSAHLFELFSSIQGEGLHVGERQIFIRFAGCNLTCQYCDSPQALVLSPTYKFEAVPGSHKFETHENPVEVGKLVEFVSLLDKPAGIHHSISLTGGGPLLPGGLLQKIISGIKKKNKKPPYL